MYLTLVLFHDFSALLVFDLKDIGVICPEIFDLDPDKSRDCFDFIRALVAIALICIQGATKLFVYWRWRWLGEEIGFVIGFVAKRMELYVDMAGAFIVFALHWSIVEWANCAGLDETIDLGNFRLGPFSCVSLE
jgi:hypothetical protein